MLESAGKSASIGEMLTIIDAASPPPGERMTNMFDSFVSSVQFGGIVHDIPCRSHFTSVPPASAAVCSAVGLAVSTDRLEPEPVGPELEPLPFLNLPERLHRERAKAISTTSRIFFMRRLLFQDTAKSQYFGPGPTSWYSLALPCKKPPSKNNFARKRVPLWRMPL